MVAVPWPTESCIWAPKRLGCDGKELIVVCGVQAPAFKHGEEAPLSFLCCTQPTVRCMSNAHKLARAEAEAARPRIWWMPLERRQVGRPHARCQPTSIGKPKPGRGRAACGSP